jgi:hypothetical protein
MMFPYSQSVSPDDQAHIEYHQAYLRTVWILDPQRALILRDLLDATYQYDSIVAGDILLDLDRELHCVIAAVA